MGRSRVHLEHRQWAGLLLFAGTAEFAIGMSVAQALSPGYNMSRDFLGDLGVGPSAVAFNVAIILLGLALLAAAWFLFRAYRDWPVAVGVALTGIGAVGFGAVPAIDAYPYLTIHTAFALLAYGFGALSPILALRIVRPPFGYISVALGVASLAALGLLGSDTYLGLDRGGMERLVVWPILIWGIALGGSLFTMTSEGPKRPVLAGPPTA